MISDDTCLGEAVNVDASTAVQGSVTQQQEPDEEVVNIIDPIFSTEDIMKEHLLQQEALLRIKYGAELSECCSLPYYIHSNTTDYINYKMVNKEISWEAIISYVNIGLDHEFYTDIKDIINSTDLTVLVNKYNQLPSDYKPDKLEQIKSRYSSRSLYLRSDARVAFEVMCDAARNEGIYLKAISAFRSYSYQATLYLKKKTPSMSLEEYQKERDRVSARAGHSEHQTGLAVDINSMAQSFGTTTAGIWLVENSYKYGYIVRYPQGKEVITGYDYEPWHFRYLGSDLAQSVYVSGLSYDEFYINILIN
jgi:D-alanyl-D-alanine carboxypeptidase